jgi:peptide/nickel transport system permease protein
MHRAFLRYAVRRAAVAAVLVLLASSAALVLARLAPGDRLEFGADPAVVAAERRRLGLDRPLLEQYVTWLARAIQLDFGESRRYRRPVGTLVRERAGNSVQLGVAALIVATGLGVPLGMLTGTRRGGALVPVTTGLSVLLLSLPPLVTSLALLLFATRTGWFPAGGLPPESATTMEVLRYLALPVLALALPIAAMLERLHSRAVSDALAEPCIVAALARGIPRRRIVWRHAFVLSLKPVLAIYGIVIGAVISGSFAVEYVMAWQGLGALMYEALVGRDAYLVAGCTAAGSLFLAGGILCSDLAIAALDPRTEVLG